MKTRKKFVSLLITLTTLFSMFAISSNAVEEKTEEIYAIFTEEYLFEYTFDSQGNIITTPESIDSLAILSNDKKAIKKILFDKSTSTSTIRNDKSLEDETKNCIQSISNIKQSCLKGEKVVISDHKIINGIKSLSNFTKSITKQAQTSYGSNGVKLTVRYNWTWNYSPILTLTDIVSIVWSDTFDSDGANVRFVYNQYGYRRITDEDGSYSYDFSDTASTTNLNLSGGSAYSSGQPSVGFQKSYDIKRVFYKNAKTYFVSKHSGYFQVVVFRVALPSNDDGAITFCGDYFHQRVKPNLTLTLTPTGPEGTIGLSACYDRAPSCVKSIVYR